MAEEDWQALVEGATIERYQRVGQSMVVHLSGPEEERVVQFSYRLHARYPLSVWTAPSRAYLDGDPLRVAVRAPTRISVGE
jgi:hypothetical protein